MYRTAAAAFLLAALLPAQTEPAFEAASIKPRQSSTGPFHFDVYPNRLDALNINLRYFVAQAYDLPDFQISAPAWLTERHYDLQATSGPAVSRDQMRVLLRNLLADRFHLATHWEERTQSIFRLTVLPGGHKMKTTDHGYAAVNSPTRSDSGLTLTGPMSMRQLAGSLTHWAGKPVLDATSLEGFFLISLTFAPDDVSFDSTAAFPAPRLPNALQEQLGLKIAAAGGPVKYLVIDRADQVPTGN